MTTTPYINVFELLNPHLYETPRVGSHSIEVHSAVRNPPTILTHKDEFFQGIAKFGFHDTMFSSPHTVWFPNQTIEVRGLRVSVVKIPTVIDLNYLWCTEYFHFLTEVLPNALFLKNAGVSFPIFCKTSSFTIPAFQWFGITNEVISAFPPIKTKQLVPMYVECGNPSFQKIQLLRNVIETKVRFESTHGILLRRHGTRELLNEEDIFQFFQAAYSHLTWVIFDTLPIGETAALFSKAEILVGPHGAGLTNMIFAPKGVKIFEIMPESDPNVCYWHLAEMLGHSYKMLPVPCDRRNSMNVDVSLLTYLHMSAERESKCGLS